MRGKYKTGTDQTREPDWRRSDEAAAAFDVTRTTLVNWREDARVRWSKIGGTVYYDVSSIEEIRTANTHEIAI